MQKTIREWAVDHSAYVLVAVPMLVSEVVGAAGDAAGRYLISDYLLRVEGVRESIPVWLFPLLVALQAVYFLGSLIYLWPVIRVQGKFRSHPVSNLDQARTRLYNYPPFLIVSTWVTWAAGHMLFAIWGRGTIPVAPVIVYAFISVILNAVIAYYAADLIIRSVFNPYWFPDGRFEVSYRLRTPWLSLRFHDMFLVSAVFPVISIVGIVAMTSYYGQHDAGELTRLTVVCGIVGGVFWFFGFLLTLLNSKVFISPIETMARAASRIGNGQFETRIPVHSDDALGKLETAINSLGRTLGEKELIKTVFGHYVSPAVRDLILGGKVRTDGDEIEAVVLFSDIRSFTSLSERHPPEKIIRLLNVHFSRAVDIVSRHNGFVDKFIGDAMMAVFDADLTRETHRHSALTAAAELLQELYETNREIGALGLGPIEIGVGLACGRVIRGNVGSADRREMTVIGSTVNLASRLESATCELGFPICASAELFNETMSGVSALRIAEKKSIHLKGISDPVNIVAMTLA